MRRRRGKINYISKRYAFAKKNGSMHVKLENIFLGKNELQRPILAVLVKD